MKMSLFSRFSGSSLPLVVQAAVILAASALVVITTLVTSNYTLNEADEVATESDAALVAAHIESDIHAVRSYMEELAGSNSLDLNLVLEAHDAMLELDQRTVELVQLIGSEETLQIRRLVQDCQATLRAFFRTQAPSDMRQVIAQLDGLDQIIGQRVGVFEAQADRDQSELESATRLSGWILVAIATLTAIVILLMSMLIGQRQRRMLVQTARERDTLAELTTAVQKRNDQFSALYQIVGEITDNLSMRYVVNTTVSEAGQLVKADYVELRLLDEDSLVARGSMQSDEAFVATGEPLLLGIGLSGRAAKRGKTIRLDAGVEASMADSERVSGMESGLIVPLIVGARVVGTLACWSREAGRFDSDDERILELMASQVATAVAAADLHEMSERRASHDPLTGLPNRRQLNQDTPELQQALDAGRAMAVAMLDVDHFKRFNDDFGHRVGDVTLQKVAEVMKRAVRETDEVYRYGGEEFLVVFKDVDESDAVRLSERLRQAVGKTVLTGERLEPVGPVTISSGLALAPVHSTDLATLIRLADEALYASKENGRNRTTVTGSVNGATAAA
jgi:diguanylate cyclase (GGDEF)-like protein